MRRLLAICLIGWPAFAASFDCGKAGTPAEKAICSTPRLSALDEELAAVYAAARKTNADVRESQREWMAGDREECDDDADCLEASYLTRIAALRLANPTLFARAKVPPSVIGRYSEKTDVCFAVPDEDEDQKCEEGENFLEIRRGKDNVLTVDSQLIFYNAHLCTVEDAPAEWVPGPPGELRVALLAEEDGIPYCVLLLRFEKGNVSFTDPYGRCRWLCGARAGFDGTQLPRSGTQLPKK